MLRRTAPATAAMAVARPPSQLVLDGPDRLVALGFRNWMLGYQTGEIACWELAWREFSTALGAQPARDVVTGLSCWVRCIGGASQRPIEVFPAGCARFCRDECIAVSLIAACQHDACPAMRACAFALVETSDLGAVVTESTAFAGCLKASGQILSPGAIATSAVFATSQRPSTAH